MVCFRLDLYDMTIKEEMMHVLERIAATIPSRKVTVILCLEGNPEYAQLYGSKNRKAHITVVSASTTEEAINNIIMQTFHEAKASQRRP